MMTDPAAITPDAIRLRAHEKWLERGRPSGSPEIDWFDAERELLARAETLASGSSAATAPLLAPTLQVSSAGVPRRRAPRSIVTRAGSAPAARLLAALVPEASAGLAGHAVGVAGRGRR